MRLRPAGTDDNRDVINVLFRLKDDPKWDKHIERAILALYYVHVIEFMAIDK